MTNPERNPESSAAAPANLSAEDRSKDEFFVKLAVVVEAMIKAHGKDFAMGALILSARFVAEGKPLIKSNSGSIGEWMHAAETKK